MLIVLLLCYRDTSCVSQHAVWCSVAREFYALGEEGAPFFNACLAIFCIAQVPARLPSHTDLILVS